MAKFSIVNKEECIACGACSGIAPDIFEYDDDGYAQNIYKSDNNTGTAEIASDLTDDLLEAMEGCPTEAIKVSDRPFG